jgi:hypothetical protein
MLHDTYDYIILGDKLDPEDTDKEMISHSSEIAKVLRPASPSSQALVEEFLMDLLTRSIFGSNYIDEAGGDLHTTLHLCGMIFRTERIPEIVNDGDWVYVCLRLYLVDKGRPSDHQSILRIFREIVQHGKAASFLINEVYLEGKDLTEDIILVTHRRLTHEINTDQGDSWKDYSGVYRKH